MYNLRKTLEGWVFVMLGGYIIYKLDRLAWVRVNGDADGVLISDTSGQKINLLLADVATTQVLPASPIAAPATVGEFLTLLNSSFFENIASVGGGGGNIEENEVEVSSGTYFVTASDKNIICTGDCTIVLPPTTDGKFSFRIWVLLGVTASLKGSAGDTVNNETDITLYELEMVTVRNLLTLPNWSIGH